MPFPRKHKIWYLDCISDHYSCISGRSKTAVKLFISFWLCIIYKNEFTVHLSIVNNELMIGGYYSIIKSNSITKDPERSELMKDKPNPELLHKLFQHTMSDNPQIRAAAYTALSNFEPDDSVISCLLAGLEDENPAVRKAAGGSLIDLGYLNSVPHSRA